MTDIELEQLMQEQKVNRTAVDHIRELYNISQENYDLTAEKLYPNTDWEEIRCKLEEDAPLTQDEVTALDYANSEQERYLRDTITAMCKCLHKVVNISKAYRTVARELADKLKVDMVLKESDEELKIVVKPRKKEENN